MAIPDYQSFMLPLLKYASQRQECSIRDAYTALSDEMGLTDEEKNLLLPSGTQEIYKNRIGWARTYLAKAGLLAAPKRGSFHITDRGRTLLKDNPVSLTTGSLRKYEEFQEFEKTHKDKSQLGSIENDFEKTPEERVEQAIEELNGNIAAELLNHLVSSSPSFFEHIVIELLVRMGYGGSRKEAGQVVGKTGDGGIDGIIKEDKLGLDTIYIQAKKWENVVSRPEIQKFVGALQGNRARKGIFITTSRFSKEAVDYVSRIDNKVILIDGENLTQLMIEHEVGVTAANVYKLHRIDSDFFAEE